MPTQLERIRVESRSRRQELARVAIHDMGGPTKTAKILNRYHPLKTNGAAVMAWRELGVPVHYVALVSKLTGIKGQELCPWGWWND